MNRNIIWKVVLILAVLVVFTVAIIPTKSNPEPLKRGLDLKGGIQLKMQVNVNEAFRLETDQGMNTLKQQAAAQNIPAPTTRRVSDTAFVATLPPNVASAPYERIASDFLPSYELARAAGRLQHGRHAQGRENLGHRRRVAILQPGFEQRCVRALSRQQGQGLGDRDHRAEHDAAEPPKPMLEVQDDDGRAPGHQDPGLGEARTFGWPRGAVVHPGPLPMPAGGRGHRARRPSLPASFGRPCARRC